jgi:hypothetical protein
MIRLLYIIGDGRSGSTLMNIALGNHHDSVAVGELCGLYRYIWGQANWCSCGAPVSECSFWDAVKTQLHSDIEPSVALELQSRWESSRAVLAWPRHAREREKHRRESAEAYRSLTLKTLQAIRTVSGKSLIVDASKLPGRAMALAMMPEVSLYLVHLVRDVRALVWARSKGWQRDLRGGVEADVPARSTARICWNWNKANLLSSWVRRHLPADRSILVHYEDFVNQPNLTLDRIGEMLRMDFGSVADMLQTRRPLDKGHIASGNRMRMGNVVMQPDFRWTTHLPQRSRAVAWALAGITMRQLGYPRPLA